MSGLRTRIDSIEPNRVALTQHGGARIRVRGSGFGVLRCAGQTRAVWGGFDESFVVTGSLTVRVWGLGGSTSRIVNVTPARDLTPPRAPRIARLEVRPVALPRLRPLSHADLEYVAADSDPSSGSSAPGSSPS